MLALKKKKERAEQEKVNWSLREEQAGRGAIW